MNFCGNFKLLVSNLFFCLLIRPSTVLNRNACLTSSISEITTVSIITSFFSMCTISDFIGFIISFYAKIQ